MAEEGEAEQEEPSIEEILSSIRQIISDDDEEEAVEEPAEEAAEEVAAEPEAEAAPEPAAEEPIELTDKVEEEASEPEPEPPPAEPEPEEPEAEEPVEEAPIEVDMTEPEPEPPPEPSQEDIDSVLTDNAENAALEAFAELAAKTAIEPGGVTLEHIVRELIRPMLRQWVDSNLPPMVERLLQQELERISKQAQGD